MRERYYIAWEDTRTGASGHGSPMSEHTAREWAAEVNALYPHIIHTVMPYPECLTEAPAVVVDGA